jgi:hypothetical protein
MLIPFLPDPFPASVGSKDIRERGFDFSREIPGFNLDKEPEICLNLPQI